VIPEGPEDLSGTSLLICVVRSSEVKIAFIIAHKEIM